MTQEEQTLLMVKGVISGLSTRDQAAVKYAYDDMISTIRRHGYAGTIAVTLFAAEIAAEDDEG